MRRSEKGDIIRGFPKDAPLEDIQKAMTAAGLGTVSKSYVEKVRSVVAAKRKAASKKKAPKKAAPKKKGAPAQANGHDTELPLTRLQAADRLFAFAVSVMGFERARANLKHAEHASFAAMEALRDVVVD